MSEPVCKSIIESTDRKFLLLYHFPFHFVPRESKAKREPQSILPKRKNHRTREKNIISYTLSTPFALVNNYPLTATPSSPTLPSSPQSPPSHHDSSKPQSHPHPTQTFLRHPATRTGNASAYPRTPVFRDINNYYRLLYVNPPISITRAHEGRKGGGKFLPPS